MDETQLTEDWAALAAYLPADLEASAAEHGYTRRTTGRQSAEMWLRLILMHVAGGLSLAQTVARAEARGWTSVSSIALHKRLGNAGPWLEALTAHLLKGQVKWRGRLRSIRGKKFSIIDATDIQEPGATGTDWRLHYSIRLPDLICDHFELTDETQAESFNRFKLGPGDVAVADRGYCHRQAVAHIMDGGADAMVRLVPGNFPLLDRHGKPFEVLGACAGLRPNTKGEWDVWFEDGGWLRRLRLCVYCKPLIATLEAQKKLRSKASRKGTNLQESTLKAAGYVMILTTLSKAELTTHQSLEVYRSRWQIELAFKRMKSLLQLGHLPKGSEQTSRSWLQAKILVALLIEALLCDSKAFSPYGYGLR